MHMLTNSTETAELFEPIVLVKSCKELEEASDPVVIRRSECLACARATGISALIN